jgi:two-component system CheB/CheR fusion protein
MMPGHPKVDLIQSPAADGKLTLVAIGSSSGGLEASTRLIEQIPVGKRLAVILVQHFDPVHKSLMVELLHGHTAMPVMEAANAMRVEADHVYVIPPGQYLRVAKGLLVLHPAPTGHGARLPFDVLLNSVAEEYGPDAISIVLTGNGEDGSVGSSSIRAHGGRTIAQDPVEAEFEGMPQSAIATGHIERVATIDSIAAILARTGRSAPQYDAGEATVNRRPDDLRPITDLILQTTGHDFTLYKQGTIRRRIERRMSLAGNNVTSTAAYLDLLRQDETEREKLASDLLINVTSFFRDPKTFQYLADDVLPGLIAGHSGKQSLRLWTAGCSSGEETYSLAILLSEAIAASGKDITLQIFASDVDPEAIAFARAGLYPKAIAADVSTGRLAKHFTLEDGSYRVSHELRGLVVFSVQDILRDPPFSRLDMVSCRNVLIYLGPEAQARALSLFHFALRPGGLLWLGSAETAGGVEGRFDLIGKTERLYQRVGRNKPGEVSRVVSAPPAALDGKAVQLASSSLAELCRRLVVESFAPAAVLIDAQSLCVYSLGPTDRYMRPAKGYPTADLLAMVPAGLRLKLKSAIESVRTTGKRSIGPGGRTASGQSFDLDVRAVTNPGQPLLLVCFVETYRSSTASTGQPDKVTAPRILELERELEAAKGDLSDALHDLETTGEEQKAIDEEAMSVNEEYQSTNEELLTSKEELQSLNEELTALNGQLQETLERQRTTANDLQNVLYSTDVATIFLDTKLQIRLFTPATRALFNVISSDIGRPLSDLNALATDSLLLSDAVAVMKSLAPLEREIETKAGAWFVRRVLPYRAHDDGVEGVVITFSDITDRRRIAQALEAAERQARTANMAKSRFLAAASHDLRQPLQSLKLVQGMLAKTVKDEKAKQLVARLDDTVGAMSGMLNSLLDINQIEAGIVQANKVAFPIDDLLRRLRGEFSYIAESRRLKLRVVPSSLTVFSDPRLLEQMIRNLLANALKYTEAGKILIGCRRQGEVVRVEIWDTGIGIEKTELKAIFEEYHQIDNDARERNRGLGLGLSIVKRLGDLLVHPVYVHSNVGKGSVFAISVDRLGSAGKRKPAAASSDAPLLPEPIVGTILVIEDDPDIRQLLKIMLTDDGHTVIAVADGYEAIEHVTRHAAKPDLIVSDFNLPKGMDGVEAIADLRGLLHRQVPAIMLTGDISTDALAHIGLQDCVHFTKPVRALELASAIERLLRQSAVTQADVSAAVPPPDAAHPVVYVVDDDPIVRGDIRQALELDGMLVEDFASAELFLAGYRSNGLACLLVDAYLPGMDGIELLESLRSRGEQIPTILITGASDVSIAVASMKAGALDFIEKPVGAADLLAAIRRAFEQAKDNSTRTAWHDEAVAQISGLTKRQREIMDLVLAGNPNKNIAADLGLSQRTVENHRAAIMLKTGAKSLPALARLAIAASRDSSTKSVTQGPPKP